MDQLIAFHRIFSSCVLGPPQKDYFFAVPWRGSFGRILTVQLEPPKPVGDFLLRWAYPANKAFGDVSIHEPAQAAGDVRDMMAAEKEKLLARLLVFRAVVAPVVTRSKAAPWAQGAPACDPPPLASAPVGGGDEAKEENSETGANCQNKIVLEAPQEGNYYTWGGCSQCS